MKKTIKLFGIAALVVVIGLSMMLASCNRGNNSLSRANALAEAAKAAAEAGDMDAAEKLAAEAAEAFAALQAPAATSGRSGGTTAASGGDSVSAFGFTTFTWPPNSVLSKYGVNGMPLPVGASVFLYRELSTPDMDTLSIALSSYTSATYTSINSWLTSHGWTATLNMQSPSINMYGWEKDGMISAVYSEHDGNGDDDVTATFGFVVSNR